MHKFTSATVALPLVLSGCAAPLTTPAQAQENPPLVAAYPMEPDGANPKKLVDAGPLKIDGELRSGAKYTPDGVRGGALYVSGQNDQSQARVNKGGLLNSIGSPVTISLWVKPEKLPEKDAAFFVKRDAAWQGTPFELDISPQGNLGVNLSNGAKWGNVWVPNAFKVGEWTHVAITHETDGDFVVYVDGKERARQKLGGALAANDNPLAFGFMNNQEFPGGARAPFQGWLDEVRIYAAALTPAQIVADKDGNLGATRVAKASDFGAPTHGVTLRLARYDATLGGTTGRGFVNAKAERKSGPDAVDWPQFTLSGKPLWEKEAEETRFLPLRDGEAAKALFQRADDEVIAPGNHWLRPLKGFLHRDVYSSDRTVRTDEKEAQLWAFPVEIRGAGQADVRDVAVSYDGQQIYKNAGPLRSLTLLLPQNETGKPYELSVAGRAPVKLDVGLQPIVPGKPKNELKPLDLTIAGAPKITVANGQPSFNALPEWNADLKRVALARAAGQTTDVLQKRRAEAAKIIGGGAEAPELLAYYAMEPDVADGARLVDLGPLGFDGVLQGEAQFAGGGKRDNTLQLGGGKARASVQLKPLDKPIDKLSVSLWVRADELPSDGNPAILMTKRPAPWASAPFSLELNNRGALNLNLYNGKWTNLGAGKTLDVGKWHQVAFTYAAGGEVVLYLDGAEIGRKKMATEPLEGNDHPVTWGYEEAADFQGGGRSGLVGALDEVKIYRAQLSSDQIKSDMAGTLGARAPQGIAAAPKIAAAPSAATPPVAASWRDVLGVQVPRSPVEIYSVSLPHGMSGGHFMKSAHGPKPDLFNKGIKFPGGAEAYADYLAQTGYDRVFEQVSDNALNDSDGPRSFDSLARALKSRGVQLGLTPDVDWKRPFLTHPNVAFLAYNIPDWHAPLYRGLQLASQRVDKYGNFAGVSIGADGGTGYVPFWDWAPPKPDTPWSEAYRNQFNDSSPPAPKYLGGQSSTRDYLNYIQKQDETAQSYGYFARAVRQVAPDAAVTVGSYGPGGVGSRGGFPWATNPGKAMFAGLPTLQVYDWDETLAHKPLYNVASLDRLQSYYPSKPAWALMDDFYLKFGKQSRQRAFALALTRGVAAIGPNWIAQPSGAQAHPEKVADQRELYAWIHRNGGAYAQTRPLAPIGILYSNDQALLRRFNQKGDDKITDAELLAGSHDGKTREALFMCLAAGWPAKLITPDEWKRGLPPEMKTVLLTGLTPTDGTWNWYDGLEPQLKAFTASGGKLILDNESALPTGISGTKTNLQIRSYITQGEGGPHGKPSDKTPLLFARNAANIPLLQAAMQGQNAPIATSSAPDIWAIPHQTGDVAYVTVVNAAVKDGQSTAEAFVPQTATLKWNTTNAIYDVNKGEKVAAQTVDLTQNAVALFAVPNAPVAAPKLSFAPNGDGFYRADVNVGPRGVPVEITISSGGQSATIYGASGTPIELPARVGVAANFEVTATELLSKQKGAATLSVKAAPSPTEVASAIKEFAARKNVPLAIALTPEQSKNAQMTALAGKLRDFYRKAGRQVEIGSIEAGEVVVGLQPTRAMQKYPQWRTIDSDLVLLGTPSDNVLLLDQKRGGLLDGSGAQVTFSPFVGEYQALNLVGDAAKIAIAVERLATAK